MAIRKNNSEASQEFWKSVKESLRQMEGWPEWKRNIKISTSNSHHSDAAQKSNEGHLVVRRDDHKRGASTKVE